MKYISSPDNKYIKLAASLNEKKGRDAAGLFISETRNEKQETRGAQPEFILFSETFAKSKDLSPYGGAANCFVVKDGVFNKAADTKTPQGVLAVYKKPLRDKGISGILGGAPSPLVLICEEAREPGNVGACLRNADAAGADLAVFTKGAADIYSPKAIRSAAGAIFRVPVITDCDFEDVYGELKALGVAVFGAAAGGGRSVYDELPKSLAVVIGNEARGLSAAARQKCDALVTIPIQGGAESLNAAVASGIILFEYVRQNIHIRA